MTPSISTTRSCGRSSSQRVGCRHGQRVWNRQPRRRTGRRGQVAGQQDLLAAVLDGGVGHGHGRHQRPRVGVQRRVVELARLRLLDQPAEVHHTDPVADVADDGEVVGHDQEGQPELVLQLLEQVDHLGLHRHVERADRLVGHDQLGVDRERPGDADPLALAAGELVGVLGQRSRRQADGAEQLLEPGLGLRLVGVEAVGAHPLDEQRLDRLPRVEAGHRVLEDHLHVLALAAQGLALEAGDVLALEQHRALGGSLEVEDRPAEGRLAAAGLAHEAVGLAAVDLQVDAVDGVDVADGLVEDDAALDREVHLQAAYVDQDVGLARRPAAVLGEGLFAHFSTSTGLWQRSPRPPCSISQRGVVSRARVDDVGAAGGERAGRVPGQVVGDRPGMGLSLSPRRASSRGWT